jgi:hypothetical protein
MSLTTNESATVDVFVQRLHTQERQLDPELHREIVALGPTVVPALVEVLEADIREPQRSWASTHAVELLGELNATDAIEAMLRLLAATEPLAAVHDTLIRTLGTLGAAVAEPALRLHAESHDLELRASLCAILARTGVRDDRIFEALVGLLRVNPDMGASDLAIYHDARALPHLSDAFDSCELDNEPSLLSNQAFIELKSAIEDLGGTLSDAQVARYAQAIAARNKWRRAMGAAVEGDDEDLVEPVLARSSTPGRNDSCWCGSKKKFKKCHLGR